MGEETARGRLVLVTGASRGIGLAIAQEFTAHGDHVLLAGRDETALHEAARSVGGVDAESAWWAGDLGGGSAQAAELLTWAERVRGLPDIVVMAAGVGFWGPVADVSDEEWEQTMAVNVSAPFYLARECVPAMTARGSGHLIFISSVMAGRPTPNMAAYSASKAAVSSLARSLLAEVRPHGIKVTAVHPGTTATGMRDQQHHRPLTADLQDPRRQLSAADVAELVVWASTASSTAVPTELHLEPRGHLAVSSGG